MQNKWNFELPRMPRHKYPLAISVCIAAQWWPVILVTGGTVASMGVSASKLEDVHIVPNPPLFGHTMHAEHSLNYLFRFISSVIGQMTLI